MPSSEKSESVILAESLALNIQSTTVLVQGLMTELRDNAAALATLEAKLQSLHENMQGIIHVVRDDNGSKSIITRMALIERELKDVGDRYDILKEDIEKKFVEVKEVVEKLKEEKLLEKRRAVNKEQFSREKIINILKIMPGVVALIVALVQLLSK